MQSIFGNIFIGGSMSLLLPAFLLSIVQERELKLKAMMRMNGGMTDFIYWLVTLSWSFAFQFVAYLWLWIVCLIISSFYPKGLALGKQQGILIIVFLFLWTACQLSFTVAWSAVYTKYKNTSLHAYMYQFFLLIGMLVGLNLFIDPNTTAIKHVLTFYSLIQSSSTPSSSLYHHWVIPKSTRPSLDLRSPSVGIKSSCFFYCGCTNGFVFIATCCVVSCHSFISSTYLLLCLVRKWRRIGYYILDVVS